MIYRTTTYSAHQAGERKRRKEVHKRTEVFQTLHPVRHRVATANGSARWGRMRDLDPRYPADSHGRWADYIVLADVLTDAGWQPVDPADLFPEVFGA